MFLTLKIPGWGVRLIGGAMVLGLIGLVQSWEVAIYTLVGSILLYFVGRLIERHTS